MSAARLSRWMWRGALATHVGLVVLLLVRGYQVGGAWLALPLLLPLPGILRARSYTCAWASMMLAFYAAGYLAEGYARPTHRLEAFATASLAAVDFACLVLFVRFAARERDALGR